MHIGPSFQTAVWRFYLHTVAVQSIPQFARRNVNVRFILIIGNERTGLWKKAFGLAPATDLIKGVATTWMAETALESSTSAISVSPERITG